MDMALISHAATLDTRLPFLHFFDGFRVSHEIQKIEEMTMDDIREMIDMDLPVALATDFNPNCANESLFFTIALACYKMKMKPREALSAVTINAAHAVNRAKTQGSIEVGKRADILILECPNPEYLTWRFAANLVHTVISNGQVVHTKLGP
jgi:imidazolonepropionase